MLTQTSPAAGLARRLAPIFRTALTLFLFAGFSDAALAQGFLAMKPVAAKALVVEDKNKGDEKTASTRAEGKIEGKDYGEMSKLVEALEERVRQLEAKLAKMDAVKTTDTATAEAVKTDVKAPPGDEAVAEVKKEVAAIQEEAKKNDGILKFFRDVEVSSIVDGYYSYNNNKVDMGAQGRAFDVRHNAFSMQLAKLTLQKANSKDSPLGFRVDLGAGETVDRIISVSDSSRNDGTKYVLQAFASYVAPVGSGLTIDFGKFYTPVGAEVIETKDNFNYSRGLLFTYGPYYHTGFRAKYAFNDKVALTGFAVNGWDNMFENNVNNNAGKTVGFSLGLTPTKKFAFTQTYLAGPEAPLANAPDISARDNWRHIADSVATVYVTDKLTLLGNFVYGSDADNDGVGGHWKGFAGYFKYAFNNRFAFSPRFEVLHDKDGLRTGVAQTIKDITLTQEVKLLSNFLTRFEFRRDFSNQRFFTNSDGVAKGNQNTFILGISYFFTNREP
ncbi:MAG: outer membrane beta-barrel protein [Blastocatellia bacterium]